MKLQVGMQVVLTIPKGQNPNYGWGDAKNGDIGTIVNIREPHVWVDFPSHDYWHGFLREVKWTEDPADFTNEKALFVLHETLLP